MLQALPALLVGLGDALVAPLRVALRERGVGGASAGERVGSLGRAGERLGRGSPILPQAARALTQLACGRVPRQQRQRPGQRVRGCFVTGEDERHHLVLDLVAAQRLLILSGGHQQVEQIGGLGVGSGDAIVDDPCDQRLQRLGRPGDAGDNPAGH